MAAQMPMAAPRSFPLKVAVMMDRDPGSSMAAPSPCTARNPTRVPVEPESPHRRDPNENRTNPDMKNRLRPYRSPSAPPVSMKEAKVRV